MSVFNVIFDVFKKIFNKNPKDEDEVSRKGQLERSFVRNPLISATYKFASTPHGLEGKKLGRRSKSLLEISVSEEDFGTTASQFMISRSSSKIFEGSAHEEMIQNLKEKVLRCSDAIQNLKLEILLANAIIKKSGKLSVVKESAVQDLNNNDVDLSLDSSELDNREFLEFLKNLLLGKDLLEEKNRELLETNNQLGKSLVEAQNRSGNIKDIQEFLKLLDSWKYLVKNMEFLESHMNSRIDSKNEKLDSLNSQIGELKKILGESSKNPSTHQNGGGKLEASGNWKSEPALAKNQEFKNPTKKEKLEKLEKDLKRRDEEIAVQLKILKKLELKENEVQKLKQMCHLEQDYKQKLKEHNCLLQQKLAKEKQSFQEAKESWDKDREDMQKSLTGWKKLCDERVANTIRIMTENVEKDSESIKRSFNLERQKIEKRHNLELEKYQKDLEQATKLNQENQELKKTNLHFKEEIIQLKIELERLSSKQREFERESVRNSLKKRTLSSPGETWPGKKFKE